MSLFLTPEELSRLTGYDANQRARIRRWLKAHHIPFMVNRLGEPVVTTHSLAETADLTEPDWSVLGISDEP